MEEFLHEYAHIMSDGPHLLAEITFLVLVDVLFLGFVWPLLRRAMDRRVDQRVQREHAILDAEHGITHTASGGVRRLGPAPGHRRRKTSSHHHAHRA